MKKTVIFTAFMLCVFIAVSLFAQNKPPLIKPIPKTGIKNPNPISITIPVNPKISPPAGGVIFPGEYNQSPIDQIRLYYSRYMIQAGQRTAVNPQARGIRPPVFRNTWFGNLSSWGRGYGIDTFYSRRIQRNVYLIGEIGYFYRNSTSKYSSVFDRFFYSRNSAPFYEVSIYPVYGGLKRGFLLSGHLQRFYPYISGGGGLAFGLGNTVSSYNNGFYNRYNNLDFQMAPTAYAMVGTELYIHSKFFVNTGIRYRLMRFPKVFGYWRDFSGITYSVGFGYGFGARILH